MAMDVYNTVKALHLIFVIAWFAGLFYIPRLFVYHLEALEKSEEAQKYLVPQLQLMTRRLWNIISWPAAILASVFAIWLLYLMPAWLTQPWMHVKLFFVALLYVYHWQCHRMVRNLQKGRYLKWYSPFFMRIWNEGATLLLFAIVFLVILKSAIHWIYGLGALIGLGLVLMLAIRAYKKYRARKQG